VNFQQLLDAILQDPNTLLGLCGMEEQQKGDVYSERIVVERRQSILRVVAGDIFTWAIKASKSIVDLFILIDRRVCSLGAHDSHMYGLNLSY
jgi:hypothetical protein